MRLIALFSVVVIAACGVEPDVSPDAELPFPEWDGIPVTQAPPPGSFSIDTPELVAGTTVELAVFGAGTFDRVRIAAGSNGIAGGPCPAVLGGLCLDVASPVRRMGSVWTDVNGDGTLLFDVPDRPGLELCFQPVTIASATASYTAVGQASCRMITDLQWYSTCGSPVCFGHTPTAGQALCGPILDGDVCATPGDLCDPVDSCNRRLLCTDSDPTAQGCPISRKRHKTDIDYLESSDLDATLRGVLELRLARWRYNWDAPEQRRLGFMIDDAPTSPAVAADGEHVDLYGYTSLAVGAIQAHQVRIQTQEARLQAQDARILALEARLSALAP